MIPGFNIISGKASAATVNGARSMGGTLSPSNGVLGAKSPVRIFLDSKEHLDWLKIDLNVTEIITVKTINAQKNNVNGSTGSTHTQCESLESNR